MTTMLGKDGLVPTGPTADSRHIHAEPRKTQQQRQQQGQSVTGKRKLEALGPASAPKRHQADAAGARAAAIKPPAAVAAGMDADDWGMENASLENSQDPSIHKLLRSVKRRETAGVQESEPDR